MYAMNCDTHRQQAVKFLRQRAALTFARVHTWTPSKQ
jgi:hypothetical protein